MAKSDIGGVWRTVGGRRIFIKDGQDLASAMKESGKFNSTSQSKAKKGDSVLEEFKKSDGNTKSFEQALNKISEMEYNNEISPDEYKEYISKIQKEYVDKKKSEKTTNDTDEYEYNLYKQAKENPDSINSMTEWSTDWEDLDKRFKDRYEKDNQKWLTEKDSNWLKNQGHDTELEKKIKNFKPSGDIDNDERRLEDISSNYFYDEVGIYNENIDSTATKWAHDKAVELNDKNKQKKTEMLVPIDPYKPEDEARKILGFDSKKQKDDLMTAEQLKGKDREEQKEINKQYLKEQNKLAKEKNDANFAKEWYEGTKKTENMAKENLERAKKNGASVEDLSNRTRQVHELEFETQRAQEHANKMSKAVSDYENGAIDREEMLKRFGGNEERMKETFEKMGYTAPTKENIDRANANARMNANIRNAYQEYKKKHPGSKINFSKFKDNYKS